MKQNEGEKMKGIKIPPAVLLREILRGWRFIILAVVLGAALFAGFRFARYAIEKSKPFEEDTATAEIYEKAADVVEAKIADRKEHLAGSILAGINPYEMAYAEAFVIVRSENQAVADNVINQLSFYAHFKVDWTEFAEEHGTKPEYLHELLNITDDQEDNQFMIRIRHQSEEEAAEVMAYLLEKIAEFDAELQETEGAHEYAVKDWSTRTEVDLSYADYTESQFNRIATLESALKNYNKIIDAARGNTSAFSVGAVLKYAVMGAVLGFAAAIFLLFVFIFLRDRLLDARELKSLYGMNNLAVFPQKAKSAKGFALDRRIAAIGRDPAEKVPEEERFALFEEKLDAFAPGVRSFALIGDVKEKEMAELAAVLSDNVPLTSFEPAPALEKKAASARSVREAGAVILVGKINESRFKNADRQLELAAELGKNAAGSIVI